MLLLSIALQTEIQKKRKITEKVHKFLILIITCLLVYYMLKIYNVFKLKTVVYLVIIFKIFQIFN